MDQRLTLALALKWSLFSQKPIKVQLTNKARVEVRITRAIMAQYTWGRTSERNGAPSVWSLMKE